MPDQDKEYHPYIPRPDPIFDDPQYRTVPADARYHNTNVTNWCFATFVDFHKCQRLLGEQNNCCHHFEKIFRAICPIAWIDKWEEQIEEGTFPVILPEPKEK